MNKIIYIIVILSIVITAVSETVSIIQGDHSFYQTVQDKCIKCHGDIKTQLTTSSQHSSYSCTFCHVKSQTNHTNTKPLCQDCHAASGLNDPQEAHSGFTSLGSDGCISCHTTYNTITNFSRPEYIDYDITVSGSEWIVSNFATSGMLNIANNAGKKGGNHNWKEVSCQDCHQDIFDAVAIGGHAVVKDKNGLQIPSHSNANSTIEAWCRTCHGRSGTNLFSAPTPVPITTLDGASLYTSYCAGCHGPLSSSSKLGATSSQIQTGINSVSAMSSLSFLSSAQVQAISVALSSTPAPTPVPITTLDGAALYTSYCVGCHGPLSSSSKLGATSSQIQTGINSVSAMSSLSFLSSAQVQAISVALSSTPAPTPVPITTLNGASLYTSYCAGCHGPLSSSSKLGATSSLIQTGINTVSAMSSLSFLSSAQVQAIADALNSSSTSTPGPTSLLTQQHSALRTTCEECHQANGDNFHPGNFFNNIKSVPRLYRSLVCIACKSTGWQVPNSTLHFTVHQEPYFDVKVS